MMSPSKRSSLVLLLGLGFLVLESGFVQAQVPAPVNILTFTSPVRLIPTNTNSGSEPWQQYNGYPQVRVSSIGSARYLILTLDGQTDGRDITTNITITRNYTATNRFTVVRTTNLSTNVWVPSGGVFVFPMNPTTRLLTSTRPIQISTNFSSYYAGGLWNLTNGYGLSYYSAVLRSTTNITTNYAWPDGVTSISFPTTNISTYLDRWGFPNSVLVYTTNSGSSWVTNSAFGSGIPGFLSESSEGNHDLTNNYHAVLSRTGTNFIVRVFRFP